MKVWRVVACRRKRSGEESEKQRKRDVSVDILGLFWRVFFGEYFSEVWKLLFERVEKL
jgi:hypothetical protein